jgi:tetratricopeptide (TPR) repeat protein
LHTAGNHRPGIALGLNNLGHTHILKGRPDLALEYLDRALTLARQIGHHGLEALTLTSLGEARLAAVDHGGALEQFSAALAIRRRIGERRLEADTLNLIGLAHRGRGDNAAAAAHFRQALALSRELGDRYLETTTLAYLESVGFDGDHRDLVDDSAGRRPEDPEGEPQALRRRRSG